MFRTKSKKVILPIVLSSTITLFIVLGIIAFSDFTWNTLDLKVYDQIYSYLISTDKSREINKHIVYIDITDSTYHYMNSNAIDRNVLARATNIIDSYQPNSVMFDLIFNRASDNRGADSSFAKALNKLGSAYLPVAFLLQENKVKYRSDNDFFDRNLREKYHYICNERGNGKPLYAQQSFTQNDLIAESATNIGHITATPDDDGTFRQTAMVVKVDEVLIPTISLMMVLDFYKIPIDSIKINWGKEIVIPALKRSYLEKDLVIPIDKQGKALVPYPYKWKDAPKRVQLHKLLEMDKKPELHDELNDFLSGSFVFIGDVSTGISDLGNTTLEKDIPLVAMHGALMNGYLTDSFYSKGNLTLIVLLVICGYILTIVGVIPKNRAVLTFIFLLELGLLFIISYFIARNKIIIPVFTVGISFFVIFIITLIVEQITNNLESAFIKNAFSKYVPKKVIDDLINDPGLLQLGGEEKTVTILFSDIASFTSISEKLPAKELVSLLNEYLTEMTSIITANGGTVDKFIGDGILAEFGAPLPIPNPTDAALITALEMQRRLIELNRNWQNRNFPEICIRVGINTGNVIVGNMGSNQVFDYTVVGDAVNLAARLESANKVYGTVIMISESSRKAIDNSRFKTRLLDIIIVKGKTAPVKVYEVIAYSDAKLNEKNEEYYRLYGLAIEEFYKKNFSESEKLFLETLRIKEGDKASQEFLHRISSFKSNPPNDSWDFSNTLNSK